MHGDGADASRRDRGPDGAQAEVLERGLNEWILIGAARGRLCRFLCRERKRREQQHVIAAEPGVHVHAANAPSVQQAGQLGHLRVAGQELLALPLQSRGGDSPLDRPELGEPRQRRRDLVHRLHDRRVRRRIQPREPEGGGDGAERAFESGGVHSAGVTA